MPVAWGSRYRQEIPGLLGYGYITGERESTWHSLDELTSFDGVGGLKVASETFRVVRMYRLQLPRLRLQTAAGSLYLLGSSSLVVGALIGLGGPSPEQVWPALLALQERL